MTLSDFIFFAIGVLTGAGWGLVAGLRNARDIALEKPAVIPNVPRIGAQPQERAR